MSKNRAVMKTHALHHDSLSTRPDFAVAGLRVGIDIVQISAIADSLAQFGQHFTRRIFTADEIAYANAAPSQTVQRLAARFAAKEAGFKAFALSEAGIGWRDIEVRKCADGSCTLVFHGRAVEAVQRSGCTEISLSLSHDGDYATALLAALAPR